MQTANKTNLRNLGVACNNATTNTIPLVIDEIIDSIYEGNIPENLDIKTQCITKLLMFEAKTPAVCALITAAAEKENFKGKRNECAVWIRETFNCGSSHASHLKAVGKMLFKLRDSDKPGHNVTYKKLLSADFDKLIKLTTIKQFKLLILFLSENDITKSSRSKVSELVDKFLNKPQKEQPFLPGFENTLCAVMENGEHLVKTVDNQDSAWNYVSAGMVIFGAGMEFYKKQDTPDIEKLTEVEIELRDELKQIANAKLKAQEMLDKVG